MSEGLDEGTSSADDARQLPKVLFITGSFRSGSTVLGNLLGELEGYVSVGEMLSLWWNGLGGGVCGCGEEVDRCPFWTDVRKRAFRGSEPSRAEVIALHREYLLVRPRQLLRLWWSARVSGHLPAPLQGFATTSLRLYAAVGEVSSADVIVDSSKSPPHAFFLSALGALDIRVLHLVRDPRGVAYSWSRNKRWPDFDGAVPSQGPLPSSLKWLAWNGALEGLIAAGRPAPVMRLRYEDFASSPEATLRDIAKFVGHERDELPLTDSRTARLTRSHTIGGNPVRFRTGSVELSPDLEWQQRMSRSSKLRATAPALPLLLRYRYPIRSGREATADPPRA